LLVEINIQLLHKITNIIKIFIQCIDIITLLLLSTNKAKHSLKKYIGNDICIKNKFLHVNIKH